MSILRLRLTIAHANKSKGEGALCADFAQNLGKYLLSKADLRRALLTPNTTGVSKPATGGLRWDPT